MIEETFIVFYEGEDPVIEVPYFCQTEKEAEKQYDKWAKEFPEDSNKLYIAKIVRKPKEEMKQK